jgi:hypothetical protein
MERKRWWVWAGWLMWMNGVALNGGTRTCTRLIGRSKTVREKFPEDEVYQVCRLCLYPITLHLLPTNPLDFWIFPADCTIYHNNNCLLNTIPATIQSLAEHFLSIITTNWMSTTPSTNTTHPLLSIAITMDIRPGAVAQKLHRDDKNHHIRHSPASTYHENRDMLLGLFVPGCDTTREIGATRVVPGSHLWGDGEPDFGPDGTKGVVDAEMKMGEAIVMLGSLYHGGGEYRKETGTRTVHIMFMCSGVYRQEVCGRRYVPCSGLMELWLMRHRKFRIFRTRLRM